MIRILLSMLVVSSVAIADEFRDVSLQRATQSVQAAVEKAAKDPSRPVYHFRPPALWMNDPNGPIFYEGYYHVFYQHNPYGDVWGHMHWGHARSKDLVNWEHLPIALWPSEDKGEAHVFSGCARVNGDGTPMLFYTSVAGDAKKRPNQQWAAIGSKDMLTWEKHPNNPILEINNQGAPTFGPDWRDPFIFSTAGRTFLVCGADAGDDAMIPIYEATTPQLDKWTYKGILYKQPKSKVQFFECPNFYQVGDKWVLVYSPYHPLDYLIGTFDVNTLTFTPEKNGTLDYGTFYASNVLYDNKKRCVLVGWVRGFKDGLGWNGCMSLPRTVSLGPDGYLRQKPVDELTTLRTAQIAADLSAPKVVAGEQFEIDMSLVKPTATPTTITLTPTTAGTVPVVITLSAEGIDVAGTPIQWPRGASLDTVPVHCYVDKTVVDVLINDGEVACTKVIDYAAGGYDVAVSHPDGSATIPTFSIWQLKSIW